MPRTVTRTCRVPGGNPVKVEMQVRNARMRRCSRFEISESPMHSGSGKDGDIAGFVMFCVVGPQRTSAEKMRRCRKVDPQRHGRCRVARTGRRRWWSEKMSAHGMRRGGARTVEAEDAVRNVAHRSCGSTGGGCQAFRGAIALDRGRSRLSDGRLKRLWVGWMLSTTENTRTGTFFLQGGA